MSSFISVARDYVEIDASIEAGGMRNMLPQPIHPKMRHIVQMTADSAVIPSVRSATSTYTVPLKSLLDAVMSCTIANSAYVVDHW